MAISCPLCGSNQITANKQGWNVKRSVVGGVLLGPLGLAFGARDRNRVMVTCLACGNTWPAGVPNPPVSPNAKTPMAPELLRAEFPSELNGHRYRVEKDGSVSVPNFQGVPIKFRNWRSFWDAVGGHA
jgi:ribosomal protein S27E